jgi:hypothetical protein
MEQIGIEKVLPGTFTPGQEAVNTTVDPVRLITAGRTILMEGLGLLGSLPSDPPGPPEGAEAAKTGG